MALDQPWHKEHFVCASCGTMLTNQGFYERDFKPYCQTCYETMFCPRCAACAEPIVDTAVIALGEKYHQHCFICQVKAAYCYKYQLITFWTVF